MRAFREAAICAGAAFLVASAAPAGAQQSLPTIDVGTASPIKRRAPAPSRPVEAPASRPAVRAAAMQEPAPAQEPAPSADERGVTPIVADQFATVTVVPNEELRRLPGATLGDVLFAKPGVTGSSFAPGAASRPVVRGLDNYRVRIQENGVGASGVSEMGEDHGVPLDPLGASQIEVVRGPATLRWGSQAIGGVVNIANNRIPEAPPCADSVVFREKGCIRAETRSAISTVDNGLETAVLLDAGSGKAVVHADAQGRRASDYRIPGYPYLDAGDEPPYVAGRQPNSSARSGSASLGASWLLDSGGFIGFSVTQFNSRYRVPGLEPTETNTRIALRQTRIASKGEFRIQSSLHRHDPLLGRAHRLQAS